MIEFDELRLKLEGMKNEVEALRDALGLEQLEKEIEELENKSAAIDEEFLDEATATNSARLNELSDSQNKIKEKLQNLYDRGEELADYEDG